MAMKMTNLKRAMTLLSITQQEMAKAINVERTTITRFVNGTRHFKPDNPYPRQIARHLLRHPKRAALGVLTALGFSERALMNEDPALLEPLEAWLRERVGWSGDGIPQVLHVQDGMIPAPLPWPDTDAALPEGDFVHLELSVLFQHLLFSLGQGSARLVLYVPIDNGVLPAGAEFSQFWAHFMDHSGPAVRVVIAQEHHHSDLNQLLPQWVPLLSQGRVELMFVPDRFAIRQSVFALEGESTVYCLEQPTRHCEPLCLLLRGPRAERIRADLDAALSAARPLLRMLTDANLAEAEQAFWEEFDDEGPYDIFKSGLNTMFMDPAQFRAMLIRHGVAPDAAEVSTGRFRAFQERMRARLTKDSARELLSREAIETIVRAGRCRMPGVYFDRTGLVTLDRPAIAAICRGYAAFLRGYPRLDVRLSDNSAMFRSKLCWHIKYGNHVLIQTWGGNEAVSILTENSSLVSEFKRSFQTVWKEEAASERSGVIQAFEAWAKACETGAMEGHYQSISSL
jgi:transcriptional regulator with XRE-family HTH domain